MNIIVPVLADIYAQPLISQLCNVYPTNKPAISIPRVRIKATTGSYDGTTQQTKYIPTSVDLIRANEVKIDVQTNTNYNVYTSSGLNSSEHKLNRRYSLLKRITIEETGTATATHVVDVNFRPDARNQIARQFTFEDDSGETVNGSVHAHINNDTGIVTTQVTFEGGSTGANFDCSEVRFHFRFRPIGTNKGRTKVSVETEMIDCMIDPKTFGAYDSDVI